MNLRKIFTYGGIIIYIIFNQGCVKREAKMVYKGDGNIIFLEKPGIFGSRGCKIVFNEFSLSEAYSATYFLKGLPNICNVKYYVPYLYIPPSLKGSVFNDAKLQMIIYSDNKVISKINKKMKNWICSGDYLTHGEYVKGDGQKKSFYHRDMYIPSDTQKQYKLEVAYTPPPNAIGIKGMGYFYLQSGGYK